MASIITHAIAACTIGSVFRDEFRSWKFWTLLGICGMLPDADVITFSFGVKYADALGHRGFFHSLFFAAIIGCLIALVFYRQYLGDRRKWLALASCFFFAVASHGILDALTTGGLGVAFFAPFSNERYFFPWHIIQVSPIGVKQFFGKWGVRVILSEMLWVWLPSMVIILVQYLVKRRTLPTKES